MKATRKTLVIVLSVALLVAIAIFTFLGCSCRGRWEKFETAAGSGDLSPKETELFEDLQADRITDTKLTELIKSGVLNEKLVEKFLNKIAEVPLKPDGPSIDSIPAPKTEKAAKADSEAEAEAVTVESFSNYAPAVWKN